MSFLFIHLITHSILKKITSNMIFLGIKNRAHTLSEKGHPCHYNPAKKNCGWCGLYSQQCNGWNLYNGLKCGALDTFFPSREGSGKSCIGQGNKLT